MKLIIFSLNGWNNIQIVGNKGINDQHRNRTGSTTEKVRLVTLDKVLSSHGHFVHKKTVGLIAIDVRRSDAAAASEDVQDAMRRLRKV